MVEQQPFKLTVEGSSPSGGTRYIITFPRLFFIDTVGYMKYSVLLHNIRSVYNVGSIFRTADGAGIEHVYLSGYTPHPIDRFGRNRSDMHKVALGAELTIPWSSFDTTEKALKTFRERKVYIVAVEQSRGSIPYTTLSIPDDIDEVVLIIGEETQGIEESILKQVDATIDIPMRGEKESLNVSVAFGIVAYELRR